MITLGEMVYTIGVEKYIEEKKISISDLHGILSRHSSCDWGDVSEEDWILNNDAVLNDGRLLSSYLVNDIRLWIVSEHDRSVTTVLLPLEY